jgi:hypothetical protein
MEISPSFSFKKIQQLLLDSQPISDPSNHMATSVLLALGSVGKASRRRRRRSSRGCKLRWFHKV